MRTGKLNRHGDCLSLRDPTGAALLRSGHPDRGPTRRPFSDLIDYCSSKGGIQNLTAGNTLPPAALAPRPAATPVSFFKAPADHGLPAGHPDREIGQGWRHVVFDMGDSCNRS